MTRHPGDCPRTDGLIDRLAAESPTEEDRGHASTCAACGAVVLRATRFDDELQRSARQLIAEELPRGILDPGLGRQLGGVTPLRGLSLGATAGIGALAVVIFVTIVGVRPVLTPGGTPTQGGLVQQIGPGGTTPPGAPLFSIGELTVALANAYGYQCGGEPAPSEGAGGAGGGSALCTAPTDAGPFTAAVLVDAADSGAVVQVTITADIVGSPTQRARDIVATALARVTASAFTGEGPAVRAANFVFDRASQLSGPAWAMGIDEGGVRVDLQRRVDGGYIVHLFVAS